MTKPMLNGIAKKKAEKGKFSERNVNPYELAMGIEVEMEHTDRDDIARIIALDHLAEIPDYYTRLMKMERQAEIEWGR